MQSDPGDTRHLNYVLEHGYRWLAADPAHRALWSPPVFFPQEETLSYSESLLGLQTVYAVWRPPGAAPDTAMQLMMLSSSVLNFTVMFWLLKRGLTVSSAGASFGAFLFAFSSIRGAQTGHQHLLPHFFTGLAVLAAIEVIKRLDNAKAKRQLITWLAIFFASVVAQLYAGLYLGWFLCFAVLIAIGWGLVFRSYRGKLRRLVVLHWPSLAIASVFSIIAIAPMAIHYRQTALNVGVRSFAEVSNMLPRLQSWVYLGRFNWEYGWLHHFRAFNTLPLFWEHEIGLGLVTSAVAIWGIWHNRQNPIVRLSGLVAITIVIAVTFFPGGHTLWRIPYALVPGAKAMRGMTRIALLLLVPASIGGALFTNYMLGKQRYGVLAVALALSLVEQARSQLSYSKDDFRRRTDEVVQLIRPHCQAFYYSVLAGRQVFIYDQLDAMWASMKLGVPTVNGYSSNYPPQWGSPLTPGLLFNAVSTPEEEKQLGHFLDAWLAAKNVQRDDVCWIRDRGI
jgi:hypothetical protein